MRGVWIEIVAVGIKNGTFLTSHLVRGVWIEILLECLSLLFCASHLVRGVWIEIENET